MATHSNPASLVGFGDIRFGVLIAGNEDVYPDWQFAPIIVTRHIPGSNRAVTQRMGMPPATLTLLVECADVATYRRFLARIGTSDALTLLASWTSAVGETWHELGRDYERFDDVLLLSIRNVATKIGGGVQCEATFQRAFDPVTGKAVV